MAVVNSGTREGVGEVMPVGCWAALLADGRADPVGPGGRQVGSVTAKASGKKDRGEPSVVWCERASGGLAVACTGCLCGCSDLLWPLLV